MGNADSLESNFSYFSDELCDRADDVLRIAYLLSLDLKSANKMVNDIYQSLAENLVLSINEDSVSKVLVKELWEEVKKIGESKPDGGFIANVFKDFPLNIRMAIGAVDVIGLSAKEACQALGWTDDHLRENLATGRELLLKSEIAAKS